MLEYTDIGAKFLHISREMLYRMNILCLNYTLEKDPKILKRIDQEVLNVCHFKDWVPETFLDAAEMSMAVAIALDWSDGNLPKSTIETAKKALIEKAINPSYSQDGKNWWINAAHNWNQVCHGGLIAASIVIADINPKLSAKTISRSLNAIPTALKEYAPDGVYPEGPTYWSYGTSYTALTSSMLESAFGTDFGLSDYYPFLKSANFYLLSISPTGRYYNFSDSGLKGAQMVILHWPGSQKRQVTAYILRNKDF